MARSLMTIALAAVLLLGLVNLTGCPVWIAASAGESADVAGKASKCADDNWDSTDPKQVGALGDAARAASHARDIADFAMTMADSDVRTGTYTDAQWAQMQADADRELASATADLAATPQYGGMSMEEYHKKTGEYLPTLSYLYADDRKKKAEKRVALIQELKGKDLNGMVAAADKAADQAVQAAAKVPKCRDLAKAPGASANRDLFGAQGARKGPSGGGGGGGPAGGGGGGGGGGPEGP